MSLFSISALFLAASLICGAMQTADPPAMFDQATRRMNDAIAHIRKTGKLADVRDDLVRAATEFETFHEALSGAHHPNSTLALIRAAQCLRIVQQWDKSKKLYEKAIELARKNQEAENLAKAWLGIEKVESIGYQNHAAALGALDEALRVVRSAGNLKSLEADLILERADRETEAGNLDVALSLANSSLETAYRLEDKEIIQPALFSRSGIKHYMAASLLQQYVNLPFKTQTDWKICENTENAIRQLLADSQSDLESSARLAAGLGFDFLSASASQQLSLYQPLTASFENTVFIKRKAREAEMKAQPPEPGRSSLTTGGIHAIETNMVGPALPPMDEQQTQAFIQGFQSLSGAGGRSTVSWRQRYMEGQLQESQQHIDEALSSYREAAKIANDERRTLPTDVSRAMFAAERASLYDRLFLNLLNRQNYSEAFQWIEQARARATADLLSSAELRFPSESERHLYAELASARARKAAALRESGDPAQIDAYIENLVGQIRRQAPGLLELVDSQPVSFDALRKAAKETPFDLLYYVLYQGRLIIWHIGPTSTHAQAYFAPASELQRLAAKLKGSLEKESVSFDSRPAKDLYFFLVAPAWNWIETKHVVIVAAPELDGLPFQALLDETGDRFLGEKIAISYAPSASVAVNLHPSANLQAANALVVVGPDLKHAETEAKAVTRNFTQHTVIPAENATRSTLLKEAAGKNVVHFATHGEYNASDPMLSWVKLTAEPGHDGRFTAAEMFELPLKSAALVTLAACEAGKASSQGSNEFFGIGRSLLYAGAQNLLLPLWRVPDEATSLWMDTFYAYARSHPLPEAAMMANRALRRHPVYSSHPYYWSAFMLIGR